MTLLRHLATCIAIAGTVVIIGSILTIPIIILAVALEGNPLSVQVAAIMAAVALEAGLAVGVVTYTTDR